MPAILTHPYAKAIMASLAVVAYAGLTAWTTTTGNGFQPVDLFPVTAAVGGAVLTYLVPILPDAQHLKTLVAGVLQAVAAVAVLFQNPGVTPNVAAVLLAIVGTAAVHGAVNATKVANTHAA